MQKFNVKHSVSLHQFIQLFHLQSDCIKEMSEVFCLLANFYSLQLTIDFWGRLQTLPCPCDHEAIPSSVSS
jgi:hypothetical protein